MVVSAMRITLCNEVIRELPFPEQCVFAAAVGYDGLELAPFTLGENPQHLAPAERARLRRAAADAGVDIIGLHWLLVTPKGLSINTPDRATRERTIDVLRRLIELCAELGGKILVHGSPAQRTISAGDDPADAWQRARDTFAAIAGDAERVGVTYCIEPLEPAQTNFINTLDEAASMMDAIGSPAFRTMIDTRAAGRSEELPIPDLLNRWLPTGKVAHIQVSDRTRRAPGQGPDRFAPVFAALLRNRYHGAVSVEPLDYHPHGPATAARAIGYLRAILETLTWQQQV